MTKARNLSKIIDGSGNLVIPNAGNDARSLGMVKADGTPIDALDRATTVATQINTSTPYAGIIPSNNCSGATNPLDKDPNYNTSQTYENPSGQAVNYTIDLKKPRNGNWWEWSSYGFTGIPTSNCANNGAYDGAGGYTSSFQPVSVENIFSDYTNTDELGGTYSARTVQNCNCGSFNCRTNCNCNCACACNCQCSTDGSCFVAGTKIKLADGSLKSIEDIQVGEVVVGKNNSLNKVIGLWRPKLGLRTIFNINDGLVKTTGDHLIDTNNGWGSLDLSIYSNRYNKTILLNNGIEVKNSAISKPNKIKIGSNLKTFDNSIINVVSINTEDNYNSETQLFTLATDGTYSFTLESGIVVDGMPQTEE